MVTLAGNGIVDLGLSASAVSLVSHPSMRKQSLFSTYQQMIPFFPTGVDDECKMYTYAMSRPTYQEGFSDWRLSKRGKILVFRYLFVVYGGDPFVKDESRWKQEEIEQVVRDN